MTSISPTISGASDVSDHDARRFVSLPKTTMGWVAVAVGIAYTALMTVMARTVLGLPTWLDFTLGLVPGAAAAILIGLALTRFRERSWLVWLTAAGVLWGFGGWLVFAIMAS